MARIFTNFMYGTLSAGVTAVATTASSTAFASLPVVASPDTMSLVLNPYADGGLVQEIVTVTTHTASSTSITMIRAQESTTGQAHPSATRWIAGVTKSDWDEAPNTIPVWMAM